MIQYITNFFYAGISTIGFAVLFNSPKSSLLKAGFAGGLGSVIYLLSNNISSSNVLASFVAAFVIAIIGQFFAVKCKNPITIYIIPGITPLVPGYALYHTMLAIVEKRFEDAAIKGSEVLLISVAIAAALVIVLSFNSFRKQRQFQSR